MKKYKFSKTYVASVLYRYAFLLFVPVLQGVLFAESSEVLLLTLYSTDLAVLVLIISVAVTRCSKSVLYLDKNKLTIKSGVLIKTEEKTFINKRVSFLFTDGLFLRLMGGCRLRLFAGSSFSSAYLRQRDRKDILRILTNKKPAKIINSGIFRNLLMSFSFSNALTGLLASAPIIRRVSLIMGARQTALILEGANLEGLLRFTGLPPVLSKVSAIIFFCWVLGFFAEFFSEYGLKLYVFSSHFLVQKGLMAKTQVLFLKKSVRLLVYRQSILMFLLGFYSAQLRLNIKPKQKIHILSAARFTTCENLREEIFGKVKETTNPIYPPAKALWGYTYLPFACLIISALTVLFFSANFIVKTVFSVLLLIFAIWFLFRFFALYRCSVKFYDELLEVKYFAGMNFTRTIFSTKDIVSIEISQSLFQQISGRCNLKIKVANSKAQIVKIKHIVMKEFESKKIPPF